MSHYRDKLREQKARKRYLEGKLIHEGYYTDEGMAKRRARQLKGHVKYHRAGLYEGSWEVFGPVPLWARLRFRKEIRLQKRTKGSRV